MDNTCTPKARDRDPTSSPPGRVYILWSGQRGTRVQTRDLWYHEEDPLEQGYASFRHIEIHFLMFVGIQFIIEVGFAVVPVGALRALAELKPIIVFIPWFHIK